METCSHCRKAIETGPGQKDYYHGSWLTGTRKTEVWLHYRPFKRDENCYQLYGSPVRQTA